MHPPCPLGVASLCSVDRCLHLHVSLCLLLYLSGHGNELAMRACRGVPPRAPGRTLLGAKPAEAHLAAMKGAAVYRYSHSDICAPDYCDLVRPDAFCQPSGALK